MADITNPFYFDFIRGAQTALSEAGYAMIVSDTEDSGASELAAARKLMGVVDGFLLGASRLSDEFLTYLCERAPTVALNRTVPGVSSVVIDPAPGIRAAVAHLAERGHREVLYAAGPRNSASEPPRWGAVRAACAEAGIAVSRYGPCSPRQSDGERVAVELLAGRATACIAFNDLLAIGTMRALRERGVGVPGDMSVLGCDDIFGADFCDPPLSTITGSMVEAGSRAARLLVGMLDERSGAEGAGSGAADASTVTLHTAFIPRGSVGPPR